jgi:hypothetical protein
MMLLEGGLGGPLRATPSAGLRRRSRRSKGRFYMTAWRSAGPSQPPPVQGCAGEAGGLMHVGGSGPPDTPGLAPAKPADRCTSGAPGAPDTPDLAPAKPALGAV